MKTEEVKEKMLAEFREWFCDAYCMFYKVADYCKRCPIKDKDCCLKDEKREEEE